MKYKKVPTDLRFVEREAEVSEFWEKEKVFQKSIDERKDAPVFMFYDGPPTANGKPHIGHVETRTIKDLFPRFWTMKGYRVPRKAGWDTHGLPVELEIEKMLGLEGKEGIEEYGIAPFIDKCRESVWKYKGMWEEFSRKVGYWADMDHPYITYENSYIESEWWALKKIHDAGLLKKGFQIVPYCPRCGTPLASHEVSQGYKNVEEVSAIARFRAKDEENTYYLAWTTTPWTLPSNVALTVHPEEIYAKVRMKDGTHYILAEALLEVLGEDPEEIEERMQGKELEHREYEPLFRFVEPKEKAWYITTAMYVTLTDGTGIVHSAPAFGEDDYQVGRRYNLPFVQLVDSKGNMKENTDWPNVFCKDADPLILKALEEKGLLFRAIPFEHEYPHCWRCETPLIYYARDSWFIRMTELRDRLMKNNKLVNWIPESIGVGRFGNWLENVQDWALSRNRYWGTPLNIWQCECGHEHAVGSIEELRSLSPDCPEDIELHRPHIDNIHVHCPECHKEMKRTPEVIDCWFDSGAMPFAQHHYPFENQETFKEQFPANFISEAVDQTRGWFYSLIAISTLLFDEAPYKNVVVMGHVLDKHGKKMSKAKGNAVDPMSALEKFGADAVRWYFYSVSAPWIPKRWIEDTVMEGQNKLLGTLWNAYAFYILYANIDDYDPKTYPADLTKLPLMDRWLLSKVQDLVKTVDKNLTEYMIPETAKALQSFIEELSNWYIRRSRQRFWAKGMEEDKRAAYYTLYTALETFCRLAAPMIPFITESIYQNMVRSFDKDAPISVHLTSFPVAKEEWINEDLVRDMDTAYRIVELGRAARNAASVKNRQPLSCLHIKGSGILGEDFLEIIKEELNVKEVRFTEDVREYTSYNLKPQLRTLGPRLGKKLGALRGILQTIDGNEAMDELRGSGKLTLMIEGEEVALTEEDLLIEMTHKEGYVEASDNEITVVLDTNITDALREEGYIRELTSKIQTMRRDSGFEVTDHIEIYLTGNPMLEKLVGEKEEELLRTVLGDKMHYKSTEEMMSWNINGEDVKLAVRKVGG